MRRALALRQGFSKNQPLGRLFLQVEMYVRLFPFQVPFKCFFAPTSQSWISKYFRDLESLWKSNAKKWSQIWKLLLIKGVKSPRRKKVLTNFFHLFTPFKRIFAPTSQSPMPKLFRFSESLGKRNGKKWSQVQTFLFGSGLKLPKKIIIIGWFCPTKQGGNHTSRWIRDLWSKGVSLILAYF